MTPRCRGGSTAAVLGALFAPLLVAQGPAAFDAAWREWNTAADGPARQLAARRASDLFLALPEGPDRAERLAAGIEASTAADRASMATDLAREARQSGNTDARLVRAHLVAAATCGAFAEFVALATQDLTRHPAAVDAAMVAVEPLLLPMADAATRRGDPGGRFVFERLATIEPVQASRLANLALLLRHLGEVDRARQLYEQARTLQPEDPTLENDYGLFLRATGDAAGAMAAFRRSLDLDAAVPGGRPGQGPGVTNLLHAEARHPHSMVPDPLPTAAAALALRPDAQMLRRLVLDVALDRLAARDSCQGGGPNRLRSIP